MLQLRSLFFNLLISTILMPSPAQAVVYLNCDTEQSSFISYSKELLQLTRANEAIQTGGASRCTMLRKRDRGLASFYGSHGDGFAGGRTACGNTMNPSAMTVALRIDIFRELMLRNGSKSTRNICGKKIYITLNGRTVEATVTDNGDLGLTSRKIKNKRDIDLSPAVRRALGITANEGIANVTYDICG